MFELFCDTICLNKRLVRTLQTKRKLMSDATVLKMDVCRLMMSVAIPQDRKRTVHDINKIVALSYDFFRPIPSGKFNMRLTAPNFVPRLLNIEQKRHHVNVSTKRKEVRILVLKSLLTTNSGSGRRHCNQVDADLLL